MRSILRKGRGSGPMPETVLLILTSLMAEPRHGYAILKEVALSSEFRVKLSTGALYGALHRMLAESWIERLASEGEKPLYRITSSGMEALSAEESRRKSLAAPASLNVAPPLGLNAEAQG